MQSDGKIKKAICRWCHSRCRVLVHVKDNHLVSVDEDPDYPVKVWPPTKACVRLLAAKEYMYHPDRVNYALKRAREKGDGKWQQISWDQALDEIAERLGQIKEKYGAEALAATQGTSRTEDEFRCRFMNLFGTPNLISQSNICYGPRAAIAKCVMGWFGSMVTHTQTKCNILWGRQPEQSWPMIWHQIRNSKKEGKKLIVIDPRYTESAALGDLHLQLRPGTDWALALGMINVIINENLYDKEFVDHWCLGFGRVREQVQEYTPEKVAEITWVPSDKIREAARMFATNSPAYIIHGMGIEESENNASALQATYILEAITGNISKEGGDVLTGPHPKLITENEISAPELMPAEQKKKQIGADRFKLMGWAGYDLIQENLIRVWGKRGGEQAHEVLASAPLLYRAIISEKPYPVKAAITLSSNPMVTQSNTKLVYKALKKLDLYIVVDCFMTPSAELADYVLPAACWLERPYLNAGDNNLNFIIGGEAALPHLIPGEYDHHRDYDFWRGLGLRLGQKDYWPWNSLEEVYDYRLKPLGYTFTEFMSAGGTDFPPVDYDRYKKHGFATTTGKVELCPTIFEKLGYDSLPRYREPAETPYSQPELAKEYPLILITGGRVRPFYHSEHRQIESLRKKHPYPIVEIHPQTAMELGISDGDWVWIETTMGRVKQKCKFFSGIDPRVVHAQHGWWFPELPGEEPWLHGVWESNINVCNNDDPDRLDPMIGSWPLRTALCKVYNWPLGQALCKVYKAETYE